MVQKIRLSICWYHAGDATCPSRFSGGFFHFDATSAEFEKTGLFRSYEINRYTVYNMVPACAGCLKFYTLNVQIGAEAACHEIAFSKIEFLARVRAFPNLDTEDKRVLARVSGCGRTSDDLLPGSRQNPIVVTAPVLL